MIASQRHDPGPGTARQRADAVRLARATVVPGASGPVCTGTASWTDKTLCAPGVFYPPDARTPEARLRYYASRFPIVEVDSTYYALPEPRMAELWVERTPQDFVFNVKAHALMTGQPSEVARLPGHLKERLPADLLSARSVYADRLPPEIAQEVWRTFLRALEPLRQAGKMGAILLQYPRWFVPGRRSEQELAHARHLLEGWRCAVEFRFHGWMADNRRERTLSFLRDHDLPYVMVDEPQGMKSSVPPVVAVTSPALAMFRFHGRNAATWEMKNISATERFRYLYDMEELEPWAARVLETAADANETHVLFNNCYANYGTTNALEFTHLLSQAASARTA